MKLYLSAILVSLALLSRADAEVLLEESQLVAATEALEQAAPEVQSFTVDAEGEFTVTLADLAFPDGFAALDLVVTHGHTVVARLTEAGTESFAATPGSYEVRVLGDTASAGTFAVTVEPSGGGTALLNYSDSVVVDEDGNPDQSSLDADIVIGAAGTYQLTLTDRGFPAALGSLDLTILAEGSSTLLGQLSGSGSFSFAAVPGTYRLFAVAEAVTGEGGLYSVRVQGGPSNSVVYSATHAVGELPEPTDIALPATGSYSLSLADIGFPAALSRLKIALMQGGDALAVLNAAGTAAFTATAGTANLYTVADAASPPGAGSYGLRISQGTQTVLDVVTPVTVTTTTDVEGFSFNIDLPSAGTYQVRIKDFSFPQSFASLITAVSQGDSVIDSLGAAGVVDVDAEAGTLAVVVAAEAASSTNGLFGVSVVAPDDSVVFEITQGVGGLFKARSVTVTDTGSYDVSLSDLEFPAAFSELALAVTRGPDLVGQIFGGGTFSFDAAPGTYWLNFIATADGDESYGLYGLSVQTTPPAPTVTLSASPGTVSAGGTTTVTWSSTNATSCTASGGWSGARDVSGTASNVGPFSAPATLTLSCTGAGGTTSASTSISIAVASSGGGGGGMTFGLLVALACFVARRRRQLFNAPAAIQLFT